MPLKTFDRVSAAVVDRRTTLRFGARALASTIVLPLGAKADEQTVRLRLMATTDLHGHVRGFDYFRDRPDPSVGLARVATLIGKARAEVALNLLFDNGDFLQGTPLSDDAARRRSGPPHPIIAAFNALNYDAVAIGNHEFNFGLPALSRALAKLGCPALSANLESARKGVSMPFLPSTLIRRDVSFNGREAIPLTVGVLGLTPPQIMRWDRESLDGRLIANPVMRIAELEAANLRKAGADVVVALAHTGLASHSPDVTENAGEKLRASGLFDALFLGHTHRLVILPGAAGVAIPTVMAGFWGSHLGLIDLTLVREANRWLIGDSHASALPVSTRTGEMVTPVVEEDPAIVAGVERAHRATREAMRSPWARLTYTISSREVLLGEVSALDLIHQAQRRAAERLVEGTAFAGIPILSAAAAFKAGGQGGPSNFVHWRPGELTLRNLADLYSFPNRLTLLVLTGAEIKDWLEMSAGVFAQLKADAAIQPLQDNTIPPYQFDVIDGLAWRVDLAKPRRFDRMGRREGEGPGRIRDIRLARVPIAPDARFVLATNSFRADGGGNFPVPIGAPRIDAPDYVRDLVEAMFQDRTIRKPPRAGGWTFERVAGANSVAFDGHPSARVTSLPLGPVMAGAIMPSGMRRYLIDFTRLSLT